MIGWQKSARPHIQWNHIDGPMLSMRTGEVHWLTLWERIQLRFGWTGIHALEYKHSDLLHRAVLGPRPGWLYADPTQASDGVKHE